VNEQLHEIIDVDRVVHEPARLAILAVLWAVESADFLYLLHAIELTRGNLSSHLSKLEDSGYVEIEKTFEGKMPRTLCRLTDSGQEAFENYREQMKNFLGE
jgi:DNA-binding MarR family transcriptional regulator